MNNFFLLSEAMDTPTVLAFENGIVGLNSVLGLKTDMRDNFFRGEDFWEYQTTHGAMYEFTFGIIRTELQTLIIKIFDSFNSSPIYFSNEADFDTIYPDDCNGFVGIDFNKTTIAASRQIIDDVSFSTFVNNCAITNAHNSIQNFWDDREKLFPNLVFCDKVWRQIQHLSVEDDRFKLMDEKLKVLDRFVNTWKTGNFEYKNLGLDNSPDTPKRVRDTLALRTFTCPDIGNKVFILHVKWYFGSEPFRLYYYPSNIDYKVYVGYIGAKSEIGF